MNALVPSGPRYLLDTNIVSALVRDPQGAAAQRASAHEQTELCTSIVVAAELRFGTERRGSARLTRQVEAVLTALPVLPLEPPADGHYGRLRHTLEAAGQVIGANDMLIAAHALALGCVLVADHVRAFSRVPGMVVENWLR